MEEGIPISDKPIRMIAMDFDNTLVKHTRAGPEVGKPLLDFLNAFIAAGGYAGIVSGRTIHDMRGLCNQMGIPWCAPFPNYYIYRESFIDFAENGAAVSYEEHNAPARERIGEKLFALGAYVGPWARALKDAGLTIRGWNLYGDFSLEYAMGTRAHAQVALEMLENLLRTEHLEGYHVHRNGTLATIIDAESGEGNVLERAAAHVGLENSQVLALGDSLNDITMLDGKKGFVGGCVGNGDEMLKKIVRDSNGYIGEGTAWHGILDIIERLRREGRI